MAPAHKDRLTAVDASFLAQEGRSSHMHVGSVLLFEGPPPSYEEVLEGIESRLHLVPRYRQKLAFPRLQAGRPVWVDDPTFNLEYHVRHTALPQPGELDQLRLLAGRIYSQRLDRSKPLWETWVVQGLADGRFALITKTHHSMIDGIAGVDLASVLFDTTAVPREVEPEPWTPHPQPTAAELIADGVKDFVQAPLSAAGRALGAIQDPGRAVHGVREAAEGLGEVAWANLNPAPRTPLNVPIGPHRRVRWASSRLEDYKRVKNSLGGTVNDVVLAVMAGALRRWLRSRGVDTKGVELRALVPVSIRTEDERDKLGNRIAAMRGPLPVYAEDPVDRLRIVTEAMTGLKESKQALGAEVIAGLTGFAPPTILAQASRLNFSTRLFNVIVTNVPGPQFPLYMMGSRLLEAFPIVPLTRNLTVVVGILSYDGTMYFGLWADRDAFADLEVLAGGVDDAYAELVKLARQKGES